MIKERDEVVMTAEISQKCSISNVDIRVPLKHEDKCQARFDMWGIFTLYVLEWTRNPNCSPKYLRCRKCNNHIEKLTRVTGSAQSLAGSNLPDPQEANPLDPKQKRVRGAWSEVILNSPDCSITYEEMVSIFEEKKGLFAPSDAAASAARSLDAEEGRDYMQTVVQAGLVAAVVIGIVGVGLMVSRCPVSNSLHVTPYGLRVFG